MVPPSRIVALPNINATFRSSLPNFFAPSSASTSADDSISSPLTLGGGVSIVRRSTRARPNPNSPAQTAGPDSKANPPKTPAARGRSFHQKAQVSSKNVSAGIKLPACRESETRPGSSAKKKDRNRLGTGLRRPRNRYGTRISRLPVSAGMKRARKFEVSNKKNRALVGRM